MAARAWKQRKKWHPMCAHEEAARDALVQVSCPYGNCAMMTCPVCSKIAFAFGPLGCPCDLTRGWSRSRVAEMGKPPTLVKAKGRHYDKIKRRQREAREFERVWR